MIILRMINKLLDKITDDIIHLMDDEYLKELIVYLGLFTFAMISTAVIVSQICQ